jgi:hypothetical protein
MEDFHFRAAEHARHTSVVPYGTFSRLYLASPPAEAGGYRNLAANAAVL